MSKEKSIQIRTSITLAGITLAILFGIIQGLPTAISCTFGLGN